jgi:small subunit ribosomal protein S14
VYQLFEPVYQLFEPVCQLFEPVCQLFEQGVYALDSLSKLLCMRPSMETDARRRRRVARAELHRCLYRALRREEALPKGLRAQMQVALQGLPGQSRPTRVQNRCVLTGRAGSVLRRFRLSRLQLRQLAAQGMLMGVVKGSW